MESEAFSPDVAKKTLHEKGFIHWEDPALGEDISKMEQKRFSFWTLDGLDFCKQHVLYEARIRPILQSLFGQRCIFVHFLRYTARPGLVVCYGDPNVRHPRFMVQLLAKGSQAKYYGGSHLVQLPVEKTGYNFYSTPQPALDQAGLKGDDLEFKAGGIVIFEAQLRLEIKQGFALMSIFVVEAGLPKWTPMLLPRLPDELEQKALEQKVADMESTEIGLNFEFQPKPNVPC